MPTFAGVTPAAGTDGIPYATAKAMPTTEGDLFNQSNAFAYDPVAVPYAQAVLAVVKLTITGTPTVATAYVVLQTDLGDGVWVDVAWATWTGLSGSATFVLTNAGNGQALAYQQVRASNAAPSPTAGANQFPLGGRIRFTGKATLDADGAMTATIKYKLLGLR